MAAPVCGPEGAGKGPMLVWVLLLPVVRGHVASLSSSLLLGPFRWSEPALERLETENDAVCFMFLMMEMLRADGSWRLRSVSEAFQIPVRKTRRKFHDWLEPA